VKAESDYDGLEMVRMAIVGPADRLAVLMPPETTPIQMDEFIEQVERLGWPRDRIIVMRGPEAFAVVKP
jgi:hypothetical protein